MKPTGSSHHRSTASSSSRREMYRHYRGVILRVGIGTLLAVMGPVGALLATSDSWDGSTDALWSTTTNWLTDPAVVPGTGDTATFDNAGNGFTTIDLGTGVTITTILFDTANAAAYTIGDANDTLNFTTGGGITINAGVTTAQQIGMAGTTINLSNAAAASTTFTNNGTGLLTIAGNVVANNASGAGVLNVAGSGNTTITGTVTEPGVGNQALKKTGAGTLTLSNGSTWSGNGAVQTAFSGPFTVQEGILLLNGGTHTVNGEAVIGGVVTHGGAGQNAKIQVDAGALNISTWLSVGRGNGNGVATSDLTLNNNAVVTAGNMSAGFNAGNAGNIPKGTITLNGTSILSIGSFVNFAESAGTNFTMNINDSAIFRQTANAQQTRVGMSDGAVGVINVNGGTATFERDFILGAGGTGSGKLVLNSGTVNVANNTERWLKLNDSGSASTGQIDVNGGDLNLNTNTDLRFSTNGSASGTNVVNLNGGAITGYTGNNNGVFSGSSLVDLNQGSNQAGVNNTFNLNGGTLTIGQVITSNNSGTAAFNFNGGTLRAAAASTTFIDLGGANQRANVRDGGANINTDGKDVTVVQALLHSNIVDDAAIDGGLTKNGLGALTLTGANTYTGATNVTAGTVILSGAGAVNSSSGIAVNGSGARLRQTSSVAVSPAITLTQGTLDGSTTVGAVTLNGTGGVVSNGTGAVGNTSTLTLGSLTFSSAGSFSLNKANDTGTVALAITGDLTTTSGITLNMPTAPIWANGSTYNLISYGGTFNGSNSDITVGTVAGLSARQSATVGNTGASNGIITLSITGDTPYWTGAEDNSWTTTPGAGAKNWKLVTAGTTTDFLTDDQVLFDDNVTGSTSVNISDADVALVSVTFDNSANDYTISSTGGFGIVNGGGPAPLIKNGSGKVTLTTNNSFTGATSVNAGTLVLSGSNAASATTVANTATLELSHANALTGALTLASGATLSLRADADTTFTPASVTGPGGSYTIAVDQLTGAGAGKTLTLANAFNMGSSGSNLTVSSTSGDTLLLSSQLALANANASSNTINLSGANMTLNAGVNFNGATNGPVLTVNANSNTLLINGNWTTGGNRWSGIVVNNGTVTMANGRNGGSSFNHGVYAVLNGGTLNLNNNDAIGGAGAGNNFTINGGTLDNTSGSAKTLGANPFVRINADFAFSTSGGTSANDLNLGTGAKELGTAAAGTGATRTITTNGSATLTVGGVITSNGATPNNILKAGTGTLALTGNSATTYLGATTVDAGTLLVSGSISGSTTTVNNTGTLGGAGGTTGAVIVNNGGTLSPGASIGQLNAASDVTLNSGATFKLEIDTTTPATDLLAITGNFSLAGTDDVVLTITDLTPASFTSGTLTFISYTGTWNGNLFNYGGSAIADDGLLTVGANQFTLDYNFGGNAVALIAVPEPASAVSLLGGLGVLLGVQRFRRRCA